MAGNAALREREEPLRVLGAALDAASAGTGGAVLIAAEAGLGKTSVVRAFAASAGAGRARVLAGACDDLMTPRTLGPLRDLARSGPVAWRAALAEGDRDAVLAGVLTELADPAGPTVLVVEDVHWADEATLDVLRFVARRVEELPAVLVLTFRDEEVGRGLQRLLGSLRGPSVARVVLEPLSPEAVARWAGGTAAASTALYELTGGNPFFVSEVLAGVEGEVPVTVLDAVLGRVHRLDADAQAALEQLAVVPSAVELPLARALVGDLAVLAGAERAGIVEIRPQAVAYRHELARRAVEGALGGGERMRLNARVLAALERALDSDPARAVHHAVAAADDAAVVVHGPIAAADAGRLGAHAQELALYEEVLLRREQVTAPDRAGMLEACATAHFTMDHPAMALVTAEAAVRIRERLGDPVALGSALLPLAPILWALTRLEESIATIERAVALLEPAGDGPVLAQALASQGLLLCSADRPSDARLVAERVAPMAERAGGEVEALGEILRGRVRMQLGDDGGMADLARGRRLAAAAGHHIYVMYGYVLTVQDLWESGRYAEAVDLVEEGLAYGRERDLALYSDHLVAHRHRAQALRGEWDAAEAGLRALVGHRDGGEVAATRYSLPGLARLLVRRGADDVDEVLAWAQDYAHRADSRYELVPALLAVVEQGWLAGDHERAHAAVDELTARTAGPGPRRQRAELLRWRARVGVGEPGEEGCPEPWAAGLRGDWRAAAEAWRALGAPYEQALELADSGDEDATREAIAILDRLGARPAATLVRARLRDLGVTAIPRGPAPSTRSHPAGLTARQQTILREMCAGRTNTEIAAALVVSVRTVDHHVSAVLAKLGVASRREAVAAAREAGLLDPA